MTTNANVKRMVMIGLFIALQVILTRMFSISTPIMRIGFSFLPLALCSIMYGPIFGGVAAVIADIIGMLLFSSGAFFPGFTITNFLMGATHGVILYRKPKTIVRISISVIFIALFLSLGLNSYWSSILTGKGYFAILPSRIIQNLIMVPTQVFMIYFVWQHLPSQFKLDSQAVINK